MSRPFQTHRGVHRIASWSLLLSLFACGGVRVDLPDPLVADDGRQQTTGNTGGGSSTGGTSTGGTGGTTTGGTGGTTGMVCTTADTWNNFAAAFFEDRCSSCHASQFSTYASVQASADIVTSYIDSGSMPPGGLGATAKARILAWFGCGLPQ